MWTILIKPQSSLSEFLIPLIVILLFFFNLLIFNHVKEDASSNAAAQHVTLNLIFILFLLLILYFHIIPNVIKIPKNYYLASLSAIVYCKIFR
ncbi:hypothetical protein GLOIN_2v723153 [Rhizophagus irregularis DAOM 181602=DAOM 197198]|uniref:Uncharacterized protein n=1 Tax=Rhizophagus irregularis (strain DAOM 181602 / DAOM 197198 / MUCL 43194) TaxID=747089 RepID=A0A2P4P6Z1_RHIID|nr:hypothetical protein GLOIN_2v723153 [Rhizophagus irregularis DAOM 181602=DAOM 197198]POG61160.1 hypothetical protein GLOIN_2v723153 [Rhizophagus irregularis DAOM 181602=DAOM 197198]GET52222.1 hypothetical protein GLOIN_2v723153 [Rhizophagus irregularis DAOM 181602=DAOM 197198]|eukprot:XP_025168026.1 hypothetical protein GLOIN_2v723153 [Rhizophagus irregularis DAOM 181602=DAOM 197198]